MKKFLVCVWCLLILIACEKRNESNATEAKPKSIDVFINRIKTQELSDRLVVGGWLEAKNQRFLYSQVSGIVGSILYLPGQKVLKEQTVLYVMPHGAGWEVKPHPVVSDLSGIVLRIMVKQGERVDLNEKLAIVGDLDGYEITGQATYRDLLVLGQKPKIDVVLPAISSESIGKAELLMIDPAADAETGTFGVRFSLSCNEMCRQKIKVGMLAKVVVKSKIRQGVLLNEKEIHRAGSENFVFLATGAGKALKRSVSLGESWGDKTEVSSGLQIDDKIIVSSAMRLQDGDLINIVKDLSQEPIDTSNKTESSL